MVTIAKSTFTVRVLLPYYHQVHLCLTFARDPTEPRVVGTGFSCLRNNFTHPSVEIYIEFDTGAMEAIITITQTFLKGILRIIRNRLSPINTTELGLGVGRSSSPGVKGGLKTDNWSAFLNGN